LNIAYRNAWNIRLGLATRVTALLAMMVTGCVSTSVTAQPAPPAETGLDQPTAHRARHQETPWSGEFGPMDPAVPTPESVIGHVLGDGAVRYDPMVRYLEALAAASPRVTLTPYGRTHEGRTLYFLTITSEANHAKLEAIRTDNAKLADPRLLSDQAEGDRIIETLPGIAWLAYAIHGDELSSTDAALQVAYQLAAGTGQAIQQLREELVINIDPLMNPDGRERYLAQLQHLTGKVPNPDYQAMQHRGLWSAGRGNHYLFDMNRDWLMQVHPETRGRTARILEWNPHLVVDSHEMGGLDTYLFDPPREPHNVDLSESNMRWRRAFSADQARAFDRHGWSYYTQEWYEEWYPGYTNAWTSLLGAIGILYEQAGVNATGLKRPSGEILTYAEAVHHQIVSSMANLGSLRENRRAILADFLADRRWAVSAQESDAEVFLVPPPADRPLLARFVDLLNRHGIEVETAGAAFEARDLVDVWGRRAGAMQLPAGTAVVRAAQPHRRLLKSVLAFDPHMTDTFLKEEREHIERHRGTRVYDITAWNLPMAYGLRAYWAGSVSSFPADRFSQPRPSQPPERPAYGFVIDGASSDIHRGIARLLDRECQVRVALKPFTIGGENYDAGSLLLRNHENPDDLPQLIREATADLDLVIRAADTALSEAGPDLGGQRFRLLSQPRIALASQWPISSTSFGALWHLLDDRLGLRVSPVNIQSLGRMDLRKYNVIVLPHSWNPNGIGGVLSEGVRKRLRTWVEAGGTLIAIGHAAAFAAGKSSGLSDVRLRRDVLDQLDVYKEALSRERSARHVRIDPDEVWRGAEPDSGEAPEASEERDDGANSAAKKKTPEELEREDAWRRLFSPNGAILAAALDPEHWLCFGLSAHGLEGDRLPVLIHGRYALMSKYPVRTPVRLAEQGELRLSGLVWPEARERLSNTAYATVERVGYGQVILFASDPFFRGYLEGTGRLLKNALLMGPGLGTSPPVPW
jgi:hypothetical protein